MTENEKALEAINNRIERMVGLNKQGHEALEIKIAFVEASNQAHLEGFETRIKSLEERIEKLGG
tara:strand:+ start:52 stop:243 length:192 start_codon:yes stop_codon:yes gene_type:complete